MKTYEIAVVHGDGIGPEVCQAAIDVLKATSLSNALNFVEYQAGANQYLKSGTAFPDETYHGCKKADAILHGAAGLPGDVPAVPPGDQPPVLDSRRDHEEQVRSLRRLLADADARAEQYEREIAKRDAELTKARVQIATFSGSFGYRMAKLGYGLARKARQSLRKRT